LIDKVEIAGIGSSVPEKVVTNFDLEKVVDTSDVWIKKRTGISSRHVVTSERSIDLAAAAALKAIDHAGIDGSDIGLIIGCTITSEQITPGMSSFVAKQVGVDCAMMDISAGCTGFVTGLITASSMMDTLNIDYAVVIAGEALTKIANWSDRSTCVLFGDGAGAVVLKKGDEQKMHYPVLTGTRDYDNVLICKKEDRKTPFGGVDNPPLEYIKMDGREVFTYAVGAVEDVLRRMQKSCGDKPYTKVIAHQANEKILDYVVRSIGMDKDQFFINISEYGNTSSATIPIAMCDALEQGWLQKGDRVALVGFGSGLSCGGIVIDWTL
jgi:3-oxoacyl-[acyl-carrier-protein] synthase III